MPPGLPTVKSARRVVEIFEFFADRQRPATLMEIARALKLPASSSSALLGTLCQLGYLDYDRHARTFVPTIRAALLGIWVNDLMLSDGTVLRLMYELRDQTNETVVLGTQSGLHVQYIHVMHSLIRTSSPGVATGRLRPLLRSAVGQLVLSLKEDKEILAIARRINAEEAPAHRISTEQLMKTIENCRREGFGYTEGAATPGHGIIAVLLPAPPHQPPIALGVGTSIPKLREHKTRYIEALHRAVEQHARHVANRLRVRTVRQPVKSAR
jgi:DNA-binding IclR family transcriptional regulator